MRAFEIISIFIEILTLLATFGSLIVASIVYIIPYSISSHTSDQKVILR